MSEFNAKYRIKFFNQGKLIRQTTPKYTHNGAYYFVEKILRYNIVNGEYQKHGTVAQIICENGIPF